YNAHANSFPMADDIVVAEKVSESGPELRPLTQGRLGNPENASVVFTYVETYRVLASWNGAVSGDVRCVLIGTPDASGAAPQLRPRPVGTRVVAALDASRHGMLGFSWEFPPNDMEGDVVPALPGEHTLLLSDGVTDAGFAPNVSNPSDAFLCTAIQGLDSVSRQETRRTLALLMNLNGDAVSSSFGTRVSRAMMGKIDSLHPQDRWMGFAALRIWEMPGLRPDLMEALIPVATDPAAWAEVPRGAKNALLHALELGRDATMAPSRVRLFASAADAMEALVLMSDDRLVAKFIQLLPYRNYPGWHETKLGDLWSHRSSSVELALLRALPEWTGLRDKILVRSEVPPKDYTNRQELVDFWTGWIGR
ncbi:MAG: hypothetical protein AB7T05_05805, partial [Fimbriimonadaceae bacterium]